MEELLRRTRTGRKPDAVRSERIRWDGNRKRGINPRWDVTFAWNDAHPSGTRFGMVWELVTSALNGELGERVQAAVASGNTEEAVDALHDLLGTFIS